MWTPEGKAVTGAVSQDGIHWTPLSEPVLHHNHADTSGSTSKPATPVSKFAEPPQGGVLGDNSYVVEVACTTLQHQDQRRDPFGGFVAAIAAGRRQVAVEQIFRAGSQVEFVGDCRSGVPGECFSTAVSARHALDFWC